MAVCDSFEKLSNDSFKLSKLSNLTVLGKNLTVLGRKILVSKTVKFFPKTVKFDSLTVLRVQRGETSHIGHFYDEGSFFRENVAHGHLDVKRQ